MSLHAVRNIESAFTVTREFLSPLDVRRWLKLTFVVFFVGAGLDLPFQFSPSGTSGTPGTGEELPEGVPFALSTDVAILVAVVVAVAVLLGIVFAVISAIMEFVFIESLRTGDVSIRRYWRRRWRQGLRLFGFRIAIGLPVLGLFVGWMALLAGPILLGVRDVTAPFSVFLIGIPVMFVVGLLYALVWAFTTVFVVPLMIQADSGVLAAWSRLWTSIRADWKQYLAYVVVGVLLTIAVGILASVVVGIAAVVLLIPFAAVAVATHLAVSVSSSLGLAVVVGLALLFAAAVVVVWALVQVPVVTYLRYYAMLVLGDIDEELDVIPDRRKAIQE